MQRRRRLILAILALLLVSSGTVLAQGGSDLLQLLSNDNCQSSCFLGIEPFVTTQAQVEAILDDLSIEYSNVTLYGSTETVGYSFPLDSGYPFNPEGAGVLLYGDVVFRVTLAVHVPVATIIEVYGAPPQILHLLGATVLLYPERHLAFEVDHQDVSQAERVTISTPEYLAQFFGDVVPCDAPPEICNMATATPTPTQTSFPAEHNVPAGDVTGLIAAINAANAAPDPDIINLADGAYTLTAIDNATDGVNGLPVITSPITIHGGNCATITRDTSAPEFRLFRVAAGGSLTLSDVTLTNGNSGEGFSGGIVSNSGTLTLHHVTPTPTAGRSTTRGR